MSLTWIAGLLPFPSRLMAHPEQLGGEEGALVKWTNEKHNIQASQSDLLLLDSPGSELLGRSL
jgi:hypothetical protein